MAMFAAFPSTIMDSTTMGRAPAAPAPLLWRRPEAASIMVDGKAANIAIQPIPNDSLTTYYIYIYIYIAYIASIMTPDRKQTPDRRQKPKC